jgi:acetylornithine deacetylase/succinyl-diaminopimelate desuccinylase-like protein
MRKRVLALAGVLACASAQAADLAAVDAWRASHEKTILAQLDELVRLKSVAADPAGLAATATRLESLLKARGFETAQWSAEGSPPLVFGSLTVPGARRTVVFYAHYDGQPVTAAEWHSDAFAPLLLDGAREIDWKTAPSPLDPEARLHGRATADDKNSITAFLAAYDALTASGQKSAVNIKVAWEGEEERSSPHLAAILHAHAEALKSDLWLIGDGPLHQSRTPTLYFGARGLLAFDMTLYGPSRPLHDGHYGNWVPNPATMAATLIASLRDDDGHIRIPHFADDVTPLTTAARAAIARLPPVEAALKEDLALGRSEGGEGLTASTMRPALNIRGLLAGQVGANAAAAIPAQAQVAADFRLVPGETPERVEQKVEAFLKAKGWTVVHDAPDTAKLRAHPRLVRLDWHDGYPGYRSDMASPAAKAVITAANQAAGKPVALLPMMGASVPIYMFDAAFHVPLVGLPISNHDNNQHAADENIRLGNLWDGVKLYAAMMSGLSW